MFNEQEFNDAHDVVLRMLCFCDLLVDDFSIRADLSHVLLREGHLVETTSQLKEHLFMILREDTLACYFALGYPDSYDDSRFEHFDLLNMFFASDTRLLNYNSYMDSCNKSYIMDYCKSMFGIFHEMALKKKGTSTLATVLFQVSKPHCKLYIESLQELLFQLAQSDSLVTTQGKDWLEKSFDNPNLLLRIKDEYQIKSDELKSDSISRQQYELIDNVTGELFNFIRVHLSNSFALANAFKSHPIIEEPNRFGGTKDLIRTIVTKDLCECYKKSNHSLDFNTNEGKVLLMFVVKQADVPISYELFNAFCDGNVVDQSLRSIKQSCETILRVDYEKKVSIDDEFLLPYYLNLIDAELSKKYMVIMYRCASVIAKADGRISDAESQWLSQLVSIAGVSKDEEEPSIYNVEENEGNPMRELNTLIGLDSVKNEVVSLANFIKMKQMRESKGLKAPSISYHCVFTGNPGTGKTTVARILASIFKELGILQSGHLVETDRSGLVAEYVGQTAIKTNKIIDSALDGVLFVDEAYMLLGGQNDYGKEAIATLLKRMEDDRDRLIVILAGYSHEMEDFINSNPGLRSRFNRFVFFPDYSSEELFQIFKLNVEKNEYVLKDDAAQYVKSKLNDVLKTKHNDFGNARYVRNYFESVIEYQANRLASDVDLSAEKLTELTLEDVSMGQINN